MEGVAAKERETKLIWSNGKYFRAVVTPNKEKPKEEENLEDNFVSKEKIIVF